jgi:hypothetical protein
MLPRDYLDRNNAYIASPTSRAWGKVLVLRGRIPDTVNTYAGNKRFEQAPLRYWSMCHAVAGVSVTETVDCVFDEEVPTDRKGQFTIVVSTPEDRPDNARKRCGVAWLAYGARSDGIAIMRNQLPARRFAEAIHRVQQPGTEGQVMGRYMPRGRYTSTRAFERRGCAR